MCFPPPAFLFHEPNIACITIRAMESGSVQDAPLKATANCARGISSSIILTCYCITSKMNISWETYDTDHITLTGYYTIKSPTSEPVKIAGSFAANWEAVVGSAESFINNFFTCSTTSSCFTAPDAAIT